MKEYRGYLITPVPASPTLLKVATAGQGGKIPKELEGSFTNHGLIYLVIDKYLDSSEVKNVRKTSPKE